MKIPLLPSIFYFFLISSFLISGVSAVTITGATFTDALTPSETISHTMNLKADNPAEIGKVFAITIAGNGSQWVTVDKTSITVLNDSAPVTATVKIPNDAMNGAYQANILYTAPAGGMVQYQLRVPFHVTVTEGKEPTPAPIVTIIKPTLTSAAQITAPSTQAAPVQQETTIPAGEPAPFNGWFWIGIGIIILVVAFVVVALYDHYRR